MSRVASRRTVAVVTGTRAEFGLLVPVMKAIAAHPRLRLKIVAAGAHFLSPAKTIREVRRAFPKDLVAEVRMQRDGRAGRLEDAAATGRGVEGFARAFGKINPDWVVVLGDRIEAFAAASAASIAGIAVAHIHGGDRAEGIADEAMRHAITKLSHVHLAATKQSAERIVRMGERAEHVRIVGSPAIDGLKNVRPMSDRDAKRFGDPRTVVLLHPSGLAAREEGRLADAVVDGVLGACVSPVLVLSPNHDPGREIVLRALKRVENVWTRVEHLPRVEFLSLLKRLATKKPLGVLIGNSSAGLIEAAALRVPVINVGPRQSGRERGGNVLDVPLRATRMTDAVSDALARTFNAAEKPPVNHPYGDGRAGERITGVLADTSLDPSDASLLRKRSTY